jgi:hypothetical protein
MPNLSTEPANDHDQLALDLKLSPSVRLLKSEHAPLIISFLYAQFKREQRITVPYAELAERLEAYLEALNERQPGLYPRSAQVYLKQWCDDEHRFLRTYMRGSSDELLAELTPDTERTLGWIADLRQSTFIGTESRFLQIFTLLEDIVHNSTEDVEARLAQLEKQRDAIQGEIETIRATGTVTQYSATQLKERFLHACDVARQLLRDFAAVEQNFRAIARSVQEAQLKHDARKGTLVGYVLDADAELKSSDQGRSFYAFWEFLMSPSKQDELSNLLDQVYRLDELAEVSGGNPLLRRITRYLIDAGEKIVQSNARLAEQLRRLLDERTLAETRRVRELAADIKQLAVHLVGAPPDADPFMELEGPPQVELVMEKALWEPAETLAFNSKPETLGIADLDDLELYRLYTQFAIDESLLRRHIEIVLEGRGAVTLAEVLDAFPAEQGLAEILAYLAIAARDPRHSISEQDTEEITLPPSSNFSVEGDDDLAAIATLLTVPQVTYRSRRHAH